MGRMCARGMDARVCVCKRARGVCVNARARRVPVAVHTCPGMCRLCARAVPVWLCQRPPLCVALPAACARACTHTHKHRHPLWVPAGVRGTPGAGCRGGYGGRDAAQALGQGTAALGGTWGPLRCCPGLGGLKAASGLPAGVAFEPGSLISTTNCSLVGAEDRGKLRPGRGLQGANQWRPCCCFPSNYLTAPGGLQPLPWGRGADPAPPSEGTRL